MKLANSGNSLLPKVANRYCPIGLVGSLPVVHSWREDPQINFFVGALGIDGDGGLRTLYPGQIHADRGAVLLVEDVMHPGRVP